LRDLETVAADSSIPCNAIRHGEPFNVRLTLDLSDVKVPPDVLLDCRATVYAKGTGGPRHIMGQTSDTLAPADGITLTVKSATLPEGIYRLSAVVTLARHVLKATLQQRLVAMLEGGLLQIY
jgi:hypothetical protein